ncbi:hypothetical protein ES703_112682 [subsurface metagenome]
MTGAVEGGRLTFIKKFPKDILNLGKPIAKIEPELASHTGFIILFGSIGLIYSFRVTCYLP